MRNIFDQYRADENRLSHALACALHRDRSLLREWLRHWAGIAVGAKEHIDVGQQCYAEAAVSADGRADSLPDLCIWGDGWAAVIECKVGAADNHDQLRRHMRNVRRLGFDRVVGIFLSPRPCGHPSSEFTHSQWREQFAWFSRQPGPWPEDLCEYMRCLESERRREGIDDGSAITMFAGIPFDSTHHYTQREGKIVLRDLREALLDDARMARLGADPKSKGRGAITGSGYDTVWDFIGLAGTSNKNFTKSPHYTLGLHQDKVEAAITIPNGIGGGFRRRLSALGHDGFVDQLRSLAESAAELVALDPKAKCEVRVLQRHYIAQRIAHLDAVLMFDLRTVMAKKRGVVRYQPHWARASFDALVEKRSNLQFQVMLTFPYAMPQLKEPKGALSLWIDSWTALRPVMALSGHLEQ